MITVGEVLANAWRFARPYFVESEERWSARGLLLAVVLLNLSLVGMTVLLNFWRLEFYNALQSKDWDAFVSLLLYYRHTAQHGLVFAFAPLAMTHIFIAVFQLYLQQWLTIRWRRWLTVKFLAEWMSDRVYYKISLTGSHETGTDNPDQRITEDIRDYCQNTLDLSLELLSQVVTLFSFLAILWGLSGSLVVWGVTIPGDLFWIALVYALVGSVFTHFVGRPLAALFFRQQRVEADFRYSLVRVRDNVEGIALYQGEDEEETNLLHRFMAVVGNFRAIIHRRVLLNMVTYGYSQSTSVIPLVVAAPPYFAGKIQLGSLLQAAEAFNRVSGALSWVVDNYDQLARWRSVVTRLTTFHQAMEAARLQDANLNRVESSDGALRLRDLDVSLPNGTEILGHANLTLTPGPQVIVTGRSGTGKSTLFRTVSGIWPFARGRIEVPKDMFFLPQRPYIPLGTLRHVITYPNDATHYDRAVLGQLLRDVGLPHLVDRLDRDDNWPQSLSGGELQRIAIARALLAKPSWIFLDEATANLDPESEAEVLDTLRSHLPDATLVSIAHRPAKPESHDRGVVIRRHGGSAGELSMGEAA